MWEESSKEWTRFRADVLAAAHPEARFLIGYLRTASRTAAHHRVLEVIDLQRYRVISRPAKLRAALRDRLHLPFVFAVARN